MGKQDWYDMGSKIGDLVQSAVDSKDFKQLNQSLNDTINMTMDAVQKSMQASMQKNAKMNADMDAQMKAQRSAQKNAHMDTQNSAQMNMQKGAGKSVNMQPGAAQSAGSGAAGGVNAGMHTGQAVKRTGTAFEQAQRNAGQNPDAPVTLKVPGAYKGTVMMALGFSFMGIFLLLFLTFSLIGIITGLLRPVKWFFLLLAAICLGIGYQGTQVSSKYKRAKRYLQIAGQRDTCTVKELAAGVGKSEKFVVKDLQDMIAHQMFPGSAYLDAGNTCLMTSQKAYQQYQASMKQYEQRKVEAQQKQASEAAEAKSTAALSKEAQDILREGKDFINHIHACNDALPGDEISSKLSHLEEVVTKIFDQVAKQPESAPDLHKMMSYYLPVTRKLVDAYCDLDKQPIAGQNVVKTKQEIEASLDTINTAFENLLDRFFQDTAWDISSDISVLHTMMAQDGLTKRDFEAGDRIKKTAAELGVQDTAKRTATQDAAKKTTAQDTQAQATPAQNTSAQDMTETLNEAKNMAADVQEKTADGPLVFDETAPETQQQSTAQGAAASGISLTFGDIMTQEEKTKA